MFRGDRNERVGASLLVGFGRGRGAKPQVRSVFSVPLWREDAKEPAMIFLAIVLVVVGAGAIVVRQVPRYVGPMALVLAAALAVASMIIIVPAGSVGVTVLFGRVRDDLYAEGLHLANPLVAMHPMSVRTEAYTMSGTIGEGRRVGDDSIKVRSSDGLEMPLDITVLYRLVPSDAPWVYRNLGSDYESKVIRAATRTAIREAASEFSSQEAYSTKRKELSQKSQEQIEKHIADLLTQYKDFKGTGFVIQQVLLRNVSLPQRLQEAIEEKLSAEQESQRMKYILEKTTQEAEQKKIEAGGIAEAAKLVSDISDKYLQLKGIEATLTLAESPNAKVLIIGSGQGGLPVILNMPK
jgi:regulator of protease activity HflC (stomatin/prohibitin superfamily)